jgi:hypothetical protein
MVPDDDQRDWGIIPHQGSSLWSRMQQFFFEGSLKTQIVMWNAICFYT